MTYLGDKQEFEKKHHRQLTHVVKRIDKNCCISYFLQFEGMN
jgi:hypothetical protein